MICRTTCFLMILLFFLGLPLQGQDNVPPLEQDTGIAPPQVKDMDMTLPQRKDMDAGIKTDADSTSSALFPPLPDSRANGGFDMEAEIFVPRILPLPEDYVDRKMERFKAEMEAAKKVKDYTTRYLEHISPWMSTSKYSSLFYGLAGFFIPTNGMDPSFKSIPVMNGLYYIPRVPGQPLEFDESIFKDTKHFDPNVYKPTKPQMEYDPGEGLHFRAFSTPNTGGASLPNVISGEYAIPPNRM